MVVKSSKRNAVDGFAPRRTGQVIPAPSRGARKSQPATPLHTDMKVVARADQSERPLTGGGETSRDMRQDISSSLRDIDETKPVSPREKRKQQRKKRRWVKLVALIVTVIIIAVATFLILKAWGAVGQIFKGGNLIDLFQSQPLKTDAHGRSNLFIVGTTDEDPSRGGANLTDSIMIVSIDQKKHDAYMFSIPRDLYVQYGRACNAGLMGKINEYFACSAQGDSEEAERQRMDATREFIGKIVGMDIQYVAHVNSLVIRDAVNAVGGVTVNVQSDDGSPGVRDTAANFLCNEKGISAAERKQRCPRGHYIDFPNGPKEMNGEQALWFSRARGAFPGGYGLSGSNFAREKNQQLVLTALKTKATSSGTLTDIGKVSSLIDAMGKNLRTNIEAKEIRTIMDVAAKMDDSKIHRLSFIEEGNVLMGSGSIGGQSIVQPTAGLNNYTEIRAFLKAEIYGDALTKERGTAAVLNGSSVAGAAKAEADKLGEAGIKVVQVGNAPRASGKYTVYQLGSGDKKPATAAKLKEIFGVEITQGTPPGVTPAAGTDFVVIIGV